ncbi:MAG: hypothetical protein JWP00_4631, partial [Chloroflexi bacterium]|nr:hypothetical protein [Chloroflexota bacterium]
MIKFDITSHIVEIAPNNTSQVILSVNNLSQIIDFYTISIEPLISPETMGLYPGWVEFSQPTFSLRPAASSGAGESVQTITVKVTIPPQVYAGNYAGKILITARSGPENSAEIPFNIVISQVDAQTLEIIPLDQSSRKSTEVYRVVISNQGNAPHIYSVYAEDPKDDLRFIITPPEVPLRPGEQAAITLKAQPRQRNWVNDEVNHKFKVKLEGSDQEIQGGFVQKAALPPLHWFGRHWGRVVFFFGMFLALLIVAAIFFLPMLLKTTTSSFCGPVSLRSINVLSNGTNTNILVSGRNGALPYSQAVNEQADRLPGIFASLVSISPDGRRIAYVTASNLAMDDARIWIKNLDTDQQPIASIPITSGLWPVAPVWSSNGEKLAYVVRRPTPKVDTGTTGVTVTLASGTPAAASITGTNNVAPTTAAAAAAAATATLAPGQTPGVPINPSQLDLYVVSKIGEEAKKLASPPNLEPKLFYGNTLSSLPLCWASDDASLLVRPQTTDNTQTQVALADGKTTLVGTTPLPAPLPIQPKTGLTLPLNSLIGVPASLLRVPSYQLASTLSQTGTVTATTTAKAENGTGTTNTTPKATAACAIVRPFSQNDPRWADLPLKEGSTSRMADLGCPITGAAILLNYQQIDTNPAELSSCMGGLTSPLNQAGWFAIGQQCGGFKLQGGVRADFSWNLLDTALEKGPAMVGLLGGPSGSHFLVVTGGKDNISNSYTVADPWDGSTYKTLDYFLSKGYRPRWVISYEGPGAPCISTAPDPAVSAGIRTSGVADGGLYQTAQPFRYEVTGTNDNATATLRVVNPRANLDDSSKTILPNETQTYSQEGNYAIAITLKNPDGSEGLVRNIYFTIDRTPPVLGYRLTPTPDKATGKSLVPVSVQLAATDDLSGIASIEYRVNGGQWLTYTSDTTKTSLTVSENGTYTINYRATDGAGNITQADTINFVIERPVTQPSVNRPGTGPAAGQTTQAANPNAPGGAAAGAKPLVPNQPVVPTVTPVPTQTPRPAVRNTPTVPPTTAIPTTIAATPTITGTSLLPTGSPVITPTTTVLPTTVAATPSPTIELKGVLAVPLTTMTFLPNSNTQQLEIQNTGNAPLIWTLAPGSSNTMISFSGTTGTLAPGTTTSIDIAVLTPNLTGNDQTATFTIGSNGGNQTIGVIIKSQPLPSANLSLLPVSSSLNFTNTIKVDFTVPNQNVAPNHVDLFATYKNCITSCAAAPVKIGSYPVSGESLTVPWFTSSIIPQTGISLSGNLCLNAECSIFQPTNVVSNLQIEMTAAFIPPSGNNQLAPSTVISVTPGLSERTKKVQVTAVVDGGTPIVLGNATAENNWSVTWPDTSLISPFSTVEIHGLACNALDDMGVCLPIPPLTGYTTFMTGEVTSSQDLAANPQLTVPINFTVAPSANVKLVTTEATYISKAGQTAQVVLMGSASGSASPPWSVSVNPADWPSQQGIIINIKVCFTEDGSKCSTIKTYSNLVIPAGPPAAIIDISAEPKSTTTGTPFSKPLAVKVTDSKQNPVMDVSVTFNLPSVVTGPSASFGGSNGLNFVGRTDASGIVTTTIPTANNAEGPYQVAVSLTGSTTVTPTSISLFNVKPGALPITIVSGSGQIAKLNQAFSQQLSVKLDGAGAGIPVTFSAQATGTRAQFSNNSAVYTTTTDANGIATAIDLVATPTPLENVADYPVVGTHSLRVSADGYKPVLFSLTNVVGDPATITAIAANATQQVAIDIPFLDIKAEVKDAGGNLLQNIPSQSVKVIFTSPFGLITDPSLPNQLPGATFGISQTISMIVPTDNANGANPGVATATGIKANLRIGTYKITATVQDFPAVTTNAFNFTNQTGSPASVKINPPTSSSIGAYNNFSEPLTATVYDKGLNIIQTSSTKVVFSAPSTTDPQDKMLSSVFFSNNTNVFTTTVMGGVATTGPINTNPITATCLFGAVPVKATLSDLSTPVDSPIVNLNIQKGLPYHFGTLAGNGQHTPISTTLATGLQIPVLDACSNLIENHPVTFTAPASGPGGTFTTTGTISATVTTGANGAALGVASAPEFTTNGIASPNGTTSYSVIASVGANSSKPSGFTQVFTLYNDPGEPFTITPFGVGSAATNRLTDTVGITSTKVMTATVRDKGGNLVYPSVSSDRVADKNKIVFESTAANVAGALFAGANNSTVPDVNGVITSPPLKTTTVSGEYNITARASINNAVTGTFFLKNTPDVPAHLIPTPVSGDTSRLQTTVTIESKPDALSSFGTLSVKVTDQYNNIIPGVPVTFTSIEGTSLSSSHPEFKPTANFGTKPGTGATPVTTFTGTTDTTGSITSPLVFAGFYAGKFQISAQSNPSAGAGAAAIFYMRNLPDNAPKVVSIAPSVTEITTTVTTAFQEFSAYVTDVNGNGIPGVPVTFETNPLSTGTNPSGTWRGGEASLIIQTDDSGFAYINKGNTTRDTAPTATTDLTANTHAGTFKVTATVTTTTDIDPSGKRSTFVSTHNEAERIVAETSLAFTPPAIAAKPVDQTFPAFKLYLADQYNNPIYNYPVTYTVPVSVSNVTTGVFLNGANPPTNEIVVMTGLTGEAIVADNTFRAGTRAGTFEMNATVKATPSGTTTFSRSITLENLPGAPDTNHITVKDQISPYNVNIKVGETYSTPITLRVADKYDNLIPTATVTYPAGSDPAELA